MRTAGYGQAAVPRERVRRRRSDGLPEPSVLGRWENILRTVTRVERYPEVPGARLGASGFAVGRVLRTAVLFCAKGGCVGPNLPPAWPVPARRGAGIHGRIF